MTSTNSPSGENQVSAINQLRGPNPEQWHRLHPITPVLRAWGFFVALGFVIVRTIADSQGDILNDVQAFGGWAVLGFIALALIVVSFIWASWRRSQYQFDAETLSLRSGILFRSHKSVRLDRVQAINIVRPLLARLAGLSELQFNVAGGDSQIKLGFLRDDEASQLRADLLARSAGIHHVPASAHAPAGSAEFTPGGSAPYAPAGSAAYAPVGSAEYAPAQIPEPAREAPELEVIEVTTGRVIGSTVLSPLTIVAVLVLIGAIGSSIFLKSGTPLLSLIVVIFGFGAGVFAQFSSAFGFRAAISPDGIRLRHGLLETTAQTVPPGRVQAVKISQPLLWRKAGWWRVEVNIAGYAADDQSSNVLLPVGTYEQALLALWLVMPEFADGENRELASIGMTGKSTQTGDPYVSAPRRSRWLDPLAWRRHGYAFTERALFARGGWARRSVTVVPHERTQSFKVQQGPWQRKLDVASFTLESTVGPVHPRVDHLTSADAHVLMEEQAARARVARAKTRPDQWMRTRD